MSLSVLIAEMRAAGQDWDAIEAAARRAVTGHPTFTEVAPMRLVRAAARESTLVTRMVGWVHRARQLEGSLNSGVGGSAGRINMDKTDAVLALLPALLEGDAGVTECPRVGLAAQATVERAIRQAVRQLRFRLNAQTVEYLRWRIGQLGLGRVGRTEA